MSSRIAQNSLGFWRRCCWVLALLFFLTLLASTAQARALPPDGVHKSYYPDGKTLQRVINVKNRSLTRRRTYYRSGKLFTDVRYKEGRAIVRKNYYENGRLKSVWRKKDGVGKYYSRDGKLKKKVHHLKP